MRAAKTRPWGISYQEMRAEKDARQAMVDGCNQLLASLEEFHTRPIPQPASDEYRRYYPSVSTDSFMTSPAAACADVGIQQYQYPGNGRLHYRKREG